VGSGNTKVSDTNVGTAKQHAKIPCVGARIVQTGRYCASECISLAHSKDEAKVDISTWVYVLRIADQLEFALRIPIN
jgi:hypothetical protein